MPKRFISIWFPYLVTDWHIRKQPQLQKVPFALKAPSHNRIVITAVNKLAVAQGISKGMVLADAKVLCPSLQVLDDKPLLANQLLDSIAEWCIRFTPVACADYPDGVLLEATGCDHLWGGEEAYLATIKRKLTQRGYTVRAAMADTIGCAWAVARYGHDEVLIEKAKYQQVLLPLPVSSLRLDADTIISLHKLGLRTINDISNMPHSALRRRFGQQLLQRIQQAMGEVEEAIIPVYPVEPYGERLPCIEPILTITGIEIALERLLETLCYRLAKEGKGVRTAYFRAYRMDGGTSGIEMSTSRPSLNKEHLFHLFSLKLSTIEPKEGIELFVLEATRVEDYSPVQEQLWQGGKVGVDVQLGELIDRLAGKVGQEVIRRYLPTEHWWPERSFKKSTSLDEQPTTEWKLDRPRPLQLLHPPQIIEVTAPIPDYPPMLFRYKGQLHKIVKADGPERIEQEWWIKEGEHRDYYCVEDENGQRYWLFRLGHYNEEKPPQWFLHGLFA